MSEPETDDNERSVVAEFFPKMVAHTLGESSEEAEMEDDDA